MELWPNALERLDENVTGSTVIISRPSSTKYDNKYNHFEVRFARNKRYKLYDSGKMYDTIKDVAEENPLPVGESESPDEIARSNLQRVIDSYPESGIKVNRIKPLGPAKGSSQ